MLSSSIMEWFCSLDIHRPEPPPALLGPEEAQWLPSLPQIEALSRRVFYRDGLCVRDPSGFVSRHGGCGVYVETGPASRIPGCRWVPHIVVGDGFPPRIMGRASSRVFAPLPTRSLAVYGDAIYETMGAQWLGKRLRQEPGVPGGLSVSCLGGGEPRLLGGGKALVLECGSGGVVIHHSWASYRAVYTVKYIDAEVFVDGDAVSAVTGSAVFYLEKRVAAASPEPMEIHMEPFRIMLGSRRLVLYDADALGLDHYSVAASLSAGIVEAPGPGGFTVLRIYPSWIRVVWMEAGRRSLVAYLYNARDEAVEAEMSLLMDVREAVAWDAWSGGEVIGGGGAAFSFIMRPYSITRIVVKYEEPPPGLLLHRYLMGRRAGVW